MPLTFTSTLVDLADDAENATFIPTLSPARPSKTKVYEFVLPVA